MSPPPTRLHTPDEVLAEAAAAGEPEPDVFEETEEALEAESADIDRLNGYAVAGVELAQNDEVQQPPPKRGNNAFFNPNPGYVPATSQGRLSWASREQMEFAEYVAKRVTTLGKSLVAKRDWTYEVDGPYPTTGRSGEKLMNLREPKFVNYSYKKVVFYAPLEQFAEDCTGVKCPDCGKTGTWNKDGLSNNFRSAFGASDREMVFCQKYVCAKPNQGCGKKFLSWNARFLAALPDNARNDFPYHTNTENQDNNTAMFVEKDVMDKVLAEHHQIGYTGLYKSFRRAYFSNFLLKLVRYTSDLKAYKSRAIVPPGTKKQSTLQFGLATFAAPITEDRPLIDENIPTLRDYCINPHCYNGGWPTYSFLRDVIFKQHSRIIQPICDRVQRNVVGKTLAFDVHKKITKYAQAGGQQVFSGLGATMTTTKEVPAWGLLAREAESDIAEMIGDYPQRLKENNIDVTAIFLDNCCQFARIFRDIFGNENLDVFLDRAHIMFRYSDLVAKDHPLREQFIRELIQCFTYKEFVPPDMRFPVKSNKSRNFVTRSFEVPEIEEKLASFIEKQSKYIPPLFDSTAVTVVHENQLVHIRKGCTLFGARSRNDEYCIPRAGGGFLAPQGTSSLEGMFRWLMAWNMKVPVGPGTTIMRLELAFLNVNITSGSQIRGDKFLQQPGGASICFDLIEYVLDGQRTNYPSHAASFPVWPGKFGTPLLKVSPSLDSRNIELLGTGVIPEVVLALAPVSAIPRALPERFPVTEFTSDDVQFQEREVTASAESTQAQFGDSDRPLLCHRTSATSFLDLNNIDHILRTGLSTSEKALADTLISLTKLSSKSNDLAFQRSFILWNANSDIIDSVDVKLLAHWSVLKAIVKDREKAAAYRASTGNQSMRQHVTESSSQLVTTHSTVPFPTPQFAPYVSFPFPAQHPLLQNPNISNLPFNQYPYDFSNQLLDPPRTIATPRVIESLPINVRKKPTCKRCSKQTSGHSQSFCADGVRAVDASVYSFGGTYDSQWFETVYFPFLFKFGRDAQLVPQCLRVLQDRQPQVYSQLSKSHVNTFL
ncbi:hypothetical protein BCR33DRAFT_730087 [Rhizoclosmatium globosum]|uniref:Uncharacterized protein n=1 Tax=Rhizoclosmatium globosum TaxID=329046 RepID=A0A1Y2ADB9_9FUNG|nr:hypothetical protein BCR33DRAFT_776953 [Rhizoclosmatium globosum]ORY20543.1 hypothetical protein BCR33DRAFT_730087 [Rhizoclosmatium globosum]|eukprot:ORY20540.1 hypothetical protein BCR33DRAFT_776953 [Rhizoclosmatium globosum]